MPMSEIIGAFCGAVLGALIVEATRESIRWQRLRRELQARSRETRQQEAFRSELQADRYVREDEAFRHVNRVLREEAARRRRESMRSVPGGKDPKGVA